MRKNKQKGKSKKAIFICQITEVSFKLVKCLIGASLKREFIDLEAQDLAANSDDKVLTEKIKQAFTKLKYSHNLVILSLPRQQATCRYIKIPTQSSQEIEKIISFQASKYLPYPVTELLTGYQILSIDQQGYSHINLNIVHKRVVERYLNILNAAGIKNVCATLSSYGLSNLYSEFETKNSEISLIVDIDAAWADVVIVSKDKLLFSRSFRINQKEGLAPLIFEEIAKTTNAYTKETGAKTISQAVILNTKEDRSAFAQALSAKLNIPVKALNYWEKIPCAKTFIEQLLCTDISFASIVGLGLKELPEPANIAPPAIKEARKKLIQRRQYTRLGLFILITVIVFGLAVAKSLDNKRRHLGLLKKEINKIATEAKAMEELERRINMLESYGSKKLSLLAMLRELHQVVPQNLSLVNFTYDEKNQISLKGQAPDLNSVFSFVSQLEKSAAFGNFNIKVEYATKRKNQAGEFVDFEINCIKE